VTKSIALEDCYFYHSVTLPAGEQIGQWDLRRNTAAYLGGLTFQGRSVLEIGPASGFLSFYLEQQGASVTCIEPTLDRLWDAVPFAGADLAAWAMEFRQRIQKVRNAFWYGHALYGSRVRVVETDGDRLPADLGQFDDGVLASVLLHVRSPFTVLEEAARHVRDRIVITECHFPEYGQEPFCRLHPHAGVRQFDTWWQFTPTFFISCLEILGFGDIAVSFHGQWSEPNQRDIPMFSVTGRRRLPAQGALP